MMEKMMRWEMLMREIEKKNVFSWLRVWKLDDKNMLISWFKDMIIKYVNDNKMKDNSDTILMMFFGFYKKMGKKQLKIMWWVFDESCFVLFLLLIGDSWFFNF